MDYAFSEPLVKALSKFCRLAPSQIRSLDLCRRIVDFHPRLLLGQNKTELWNGRCVLRPARYAFCPLCLREQAIGHVPWNWSLAFLVRCLRHDVVLQERCTVCGDSEPLAAPSFYVLADKSCAACRSDLTHADPIEPKAGSHEEHSFGIAYQQALLGIDPPSTLLPHTTARALRCFVEHLFELISKRLVWGWPSNLIPFCRADFAQIITQLISNAKPSADPRTRNRQYRHGLLLWGTLLSVTSNYEGGRLEQTYSQWPLPLQRRFVSALTGRKQKRWPYSPYSREQDLRQRIQRSSLASVYGLSPWTSTARNRAGIHGLVEGQNCLA